MKISAQRLLEKGRDAAVSMTPGERRRALLRPLCTGFSAAAMVARVSPSCVNTAPKAAISSALFPSAKAAAAAVIAAMS